MSDSEETSGRDNKFLEMSGPPEHPAQAHESCSLEKKKKKRQTQLEVLSRSHSAGSVKIKPLQHLGQKLM